MPGPDRELPIVDVGPLRTGADPAGPAAAIGRACRDSGFFYAAGHGVDPALEARLEAAARAFFALPEADKLAIRMELGGRAWRGFFPVGAELTSGRPDRKEGLYFGAELPPEHPRVRAGVPLHGANLFPELAGFRETILAWLDAMTELGHILVRGIGLALGLPADYFARRYTADPTILFRIFHYPAAPDGTSPVAAAEGPSLGVGEHTDYGLLTILKQDETGGLQVRSGGDWLEASPVPGAFVCNLGDMLDRLTGGHFRSTPHRVRSPSGRSRLSFPFFFDPAWDAEILPIEPPAEGDAGAARWDGANVHELSGTYGEYLLGKVSRVFPDLGGAVL